MSTNKINRPSVMKDWVGPMFLDLAMYVALGVEGMLQDWSSHFMHPSVKQKQPATAIASCSHTRVIYVGGEGLGLLNSDMTNRMGMPLISYYGVTLFNL